MIAWKPETTDAVADRKPRRAMLLKAECETGDGQSAKIRVRNLSTSGMGAAVEDGFDVVKDEPITISFRGHRKVSGRVSWVRAKSFGVTFDRLVDPDEIRQAGVKAQPDFEVDEFHRVSNNCRRPPLSHSDVD